MPTIDIPYKPRPPQDVIHKELESHRFNVLVAHRRMGKSVLGINHTNKMATKNTLRLPRYAFIAPFLKQAKLIAWDYLKRYAMPIPGTKANEAELSIELPNKAKITLFGADNPEAMRGTYFDGVFLDEFGDFRAGIYTEIIRPTLIDRKGWAIFSGTPKGQNEFFEVWNTAGKLIAEGIKDWWRGIYRADETRVIPEAELESLRQTMRPLAFAQEMLCDFTAEAENVLIPISLCVAAAKRVIREGDLRGAPKIIGVDVARMGDDRSVIQRRRGLGAYKPRVFSKIDNMELVGILAREIDEWKPDAVFIDIGAGQGVIDRLRQLGYKVTDVNFGSRPTKIGAYANRRIEMWDGIREWLEAGGVIPDIPELKSDLSTPTYDFDPSNKMRLESKEQIKDRLGRSTDYGDALALTFAMPVRPHHDELGLEGGRILGASDYDIFGGAGQKEQVRKPL